MAEPENELKALNDELYRLQHQLLTGTRKERKAARGQVAELDRQIQQKRSAMLVPIRTAKDSLRRSSQSPGRTDQHALNRAQALSHLHDVMRSYKQQHDGDTSSTLDFIANHVLLSEGQVPRLSPPKAQQAVGGGSRQDPDQAAMEYEAEMQRLESEMNQHPLFQPGEGDGVPAWLEGPVSPTNSSARDWKDLEALLDSPGGSPSAVPHSKPNPIQSQLRQKHLEDNDRSGKEAVLSGRISELDLRLKILKSPPTPAESDGAASRSPSLSTDEKSTLANKYANKSAARLKKFREDKRRSRAQTSDPPDDEPTPAEPDEVEEAAPDSDHEADPDPDSPPDEVSPDAAAPPPASDPASRIESRSAQVAALKNAAAIQNQPRESAEPDRPKVPPLAITTDRDRRGSMPPGSLASPDECEFRAVGPAYLYTTPSPPPQSPSKLRQPSPTGSQLRAPSPSRMTVSVAKAQVVAIYERYNPDKLAKVDVLLAQHAGREAELVRKLEDKYVHQTTGTGPSPSQDPASWSPAKKSGPSSLSPAAVAVYRAKVVAIYQKHNPDKLDKVDLLLSNYKDRETELIQRLEAKYLPGAASPRGPATRSSASPSMLRQPSPSSSRLRQPSPRPNPHPAAAMSPARCRIKVKAIFHQHSPGELDQVDQLLAEHAGREAELVHKLEDKYVHSQAVHPKKQAYPSPHVPRSPSLRSRSLPKDYRAAIVDIYQEHNPLKLESVDKLLYTYRGREEELLQKLHDKYHVSAPAATAKSMSLVSMLGILAGFGEALGASRLAERVGHLVLAGDLGTLSQGCAAVVAAGLAGAALLRWSEGMVELRAKFDEEVEEIVEATGDDIAEVRAMLTSSEWGHLATSRVADLCGASLRPVTAEELMSAAC